MEEPIKGKETKEIPAGLKNALRSSGAVAPLADYPVPVGIQHVGIRRMAASEHRVRRVLKQLRTTQRYVPKSAR